jgi:hypothetical protein
LRRKRRAALSAPPREQRSAILAEFDAVAILGATFKTFHRSFLDVYAASSSDRGNISFRWATKVCQCQTFDRRRSLYHGSLR